MSARSRVAVLTAMLVVAGCNGSDPDRYTQPQRVIQPPLPQPPPQPPISTSDFEVSGVVTDQGGAPLQGAVVTMSHWVGSLVHWPSVTTDASGSYRIAFSPTLLGNGFVARAQVIADGYEEYWRSLLHADASRPQNFRLYRLTRLVAGESTQMVVSPDLGECQSWMARVCAVARIAIPKAGRLTVEVFSNDAPAETPLLEICCESGNEVHGNPVSVPATPGPDVFLLIGLGPGISTTRSFTVKTTIGPP